MKNHRPFLRDLPRKIAVLLFALILAFPLLWLFTSSFKTEADVFSARIQLFPSQWRWENYVDAWSYAPFDRFFLNTIVVAAIQIAAQILTCTLAAYGFAKMDFPGKKFIFSLFLISMMLPGESAIIPNYLLVSRLGLINTRLGIALPSLTSVFAIFLLRQHFLKMPDPLFEAARLDGADSWQEFTRVALPLSKSSLATIALLAFLGAWNGYMWPLLVTNRNEYRTIQVGLKYMVNPDLGPDWPRIMAASVMTLLPVVLIFLILQRYFVDGMVHSGIK